MGQDGTQADHQHWSDDEVHGYTGRPDGYGNAGYDDNNGRHHYAYAPAGPPAGPPERVQAPAPVYHPNQAVFYQNSAYQGQSQGQWGAPSGPYWQHTPFTILTPASYSPMQYVQPAFVQPNPVYMGNSAYGSSPVSGSARPAAPSPHVWFGASKADVDQENMKRAYSEGAYDKRKVAPVGLRSDQVIWVVELNGEHTLRTFAAAQELKGTWKPDPRYEAAWFFVREE